MPEVIDMARGVPQSFFIDEFASDGIMLEGIAGPPDYIAMGLPVAGERHRELMGGYRNLAQFGLMISDDSRGRVRSVGGRPGRPLRPLRHRRGARQGRARAARRAVLGRRRDDACCSRSPASPSSAQASRSPTCAPRTSS